MTNKKHNIFQRLIRKLGKKAKTSCNKTEILPQNILSASKDQPPISTLVYVAGIDCPTSETIRQDKAIANAKQVLASMDHTTASMH